MSAGFGSTVTSTSGKWARWLTPPSASSTTPSGDCSPPSQQQQRRDLALDQSKAALVLLLGLLDERQRRLFAGLESMLLGWGGDRHIAQMTGLDVHTVAKGRRELLEGKLLAERIRRPGGGRKAVEKKRPR